MTKGEIINDLTSSVKGFFFFFTIWKEQTIELNDNLDCIKVKYLIAN